MFETILYRYLVIKVKQYAVAYIPFKFTEVFFLSAGFQKITFIMTFL